MIVTTPVQPQGLPPMSGPYPPIVPTRSDVLTGENQPLQQKDAGTSGEASADGGDKPPPPEAIVMVQKDIVGDEVLSNDSDSNWDEAKGITGGLARLIHNHYYWMYLSWIVIVLILVGLVYTLPPAEKCVPDAGPGQMQVCEQSEHDWELSFRQASKRKDAIGFARADGLEAFETWAPSQNAGEGEEPRKKPSDRSNLHVLFWHDDQDANVNTNIFTPEKVQDMCEVEALVTTHPFYPFLCIVDDTGACAEQRYSIARNFYSKEQLATCPLLDEAAVTAAAAALATKWDTQPESYHAPIDARVGAPINSTRTKIDLGSPLDGFFDEDDRASEQFDLYQVMFTDTKCGGWKDSCDEDVICKGVRSFCTGAGIADGTTVEGVESLLFKRYTLEGFPASGSYEGAFESPYAGAKPKEEYDNEPTMAVRFWSLPLQQEEFTRVVNGDLNFAIFSIIVVGCYIWFHTGSAFMAVLSMFQIVMSLPVGFFLYYNIFQIKYYASVNILAIYLALGIGADSVFVASDCWNQSRSNRAIRTILGRLAFTIDRTVISCFNTTLTTVMSFVATSATPVVPIYCFACFASLVLVVNYLFVCVVTPTVIMLYHVHFSDVGGLCCWCSKKVSGRFGPKEGHVHTDLEDVRGKDMLYKLCCWAKMEAPPGDVTRIASDEATEISKLSLSERFFHNQFFNAISWKVAGHKVGAYLCIICCLAYAAGMASQAFRLTPPTSEEEWFPSSHMFNADLSHRLFNDWKGSSTNGYMGMAYVFGVEKVDRSPHNRLFPNFDRGFAVYDDKFDITTPESQKYFVSVCETLESYECKARACQPSGEWVLPDENGVVKVNCVVRDLISHYNTFVKPNTTQPVDAIPQSQFLVTVNDFFQGPYAPEELALRVRMYLPSIGLDGDSAGDVPSFSWAAITFRSAVSLPMTNKDSRELYNEVEEMAKDLAKNAPEGMQSMFQTDTQSSGSGWTWMDVEDALIQNLITGFTICFPVAFLVLVFATGNMVIAIFATASIAFIVGGVLGAAKAYYAWDLGIAESIAGVIVIGFSVDYTVHLGHMYKEGIGSREEKTRHALTYMGTTVVGGGFTTLCAGLVLFLCTLTFFTKMALLLVWTIILSIVYALCFFMPMCLVFGPEGKFGEVPSIPHLIQMATKGCKK